MFKSNKSGQPPARISLSINVREHNDADDNVPNSSRLRVHLIVLFICAGSFLTQLDRTIVTTALPQISNDFKAYSDYGWYGSAYLMTSCSFQPMFGQMYKLFDTKHTFICSMVIFEAASIICATTSVSITFILGRAIQGIGGAGMTTGAFVAVAQVAPKHLRPIYTSAVSILFAFGILIGPLLGGVFTSRATWRWCFYINLPVGIPALIGVATMFHPLQVDKQSNHEQSLKQKICTLDFVGNSLMLSACTTLILALHYTSAGSAWSSELVIGLLVGSGCAALLFVAWIFRRGEKALLVPRVAFNRVVAFSALSTFLLWSGLILHSFFLPIYFQAVQGKNAITSGVDMIPYILPVTLSLILTGAFVMKTGYFAPPGQIGCALGTIGAGLLYMLNEQSSAAEWIGYEVLTGIFIGLATQQGYVAVQAVLPLEEVPMGTAFISLALNLGGAIFVSAGNTMILTTLRNAHLPNIDVSKVIEAGATAFRHIVPQSALKPLVAAYVHALHQVFLVATVLIGAAALASIGLGCKKLERGQPSMEGEKADDDRQGEVSISTRSRGKDSWETV